VYLVLALWGLERALLLGRDLPMKEIGLLGLGMVD
jgi:hypothetical protein